MKVLILRSRRRTHSERPTDPYAQEFRSHFADKVIGNLSGERTFCSACGPDCRACREKYGREFRDHIAGVIAFPAILPYLLERPAEHVPRDIPPHDILLAINIHEQILVEVLKRCAEEETRGVVVPLEAPGWVSGSAHEKAAEVCGRADIEIAFPKPFCSFDPPSGGILAEFRERFHIGKPRVELHVRDGRIETAHVEVSAACGATYYVARWLEGRRIDEDLRHEVIAKRMHSYPCTASMKWDDELGDTSLHVANHAHDEILAPLGIHPGDEPGMVMSPVGRMVPRPAPLRENLENVERARRAVLDALEEGGCVTLQTLRRNRRIAPAAMNTALLLLKQEGKIRTEGGAIVRV